MQYQRSRAAKQHGRDGVERPERAEYRRHDRQRQQQQGVDQHLPLGPLLTLHHRHHRHAGLGVLTLLDEGERPEMRRRPVEDDRKQVDGGQVEPAGHGGPAHQRRKRTGSAADDDVLRRVPLEQHGVDQHVEQQPAQREPGAQRVHLLPEDPERDGAEGHAEEQSLGRRDPPGGNRPQARARHAVIDVPVEPHVDGVRAAGHEIAADDHPEHQHRGGKPAVGHEHRRHRGHQQQRNDARLGQGDEVGEH